MPAGRALRGRPRQGAAALHPRGQAAARRQCAADHRVSASPSDKRDVRDVTDRIMKRGARTQAWHTHKDLSAVLRWAVRHDYLSTTPSRACRSPGGFTAGERTLSDDEIALLWNGCRPRSPIESLPAYHQALPDHRSTARRGRRHGEGRDRSGRKLWSLPGARTKTATRTFAVVRLAVTLIREALADARRIRVFRPRTASALAECDAGDRRAHESSEERPLGRFGIDAWSAHDLRRTALTNLAKLGVRRTSSRTSPPPLR